MAKNTMRVTILDDGRVKLETADFGTAEHRSADDFVRALERGLGGPIVSEKRRDRHGHHHAHGHTHEKE